MLAVSIKMLLLCSTERSSKDLCRVDLGIHNHPGTPPELCPGGQIHDDWLLVCAQMLHYQGASLHIILCVYMFIGYILICYFLYMLHVKDTLYVYMFYVYMLYVICYMYVIC